MTPIVLCLMLISFLAACASGPPKTKPGEPRPYKVFGKWYSPVFDAKGFRERGIASWYGKDFHGKKTANGEIYDMHAMTAAHKTLPLGTLVKVVNLDNDLEISVRINDRGPFVRGRIIDLSHEGAKLLGMIGPGVARVEIKAIGQALASEKSPAPPADFESGAFTFQVGAFTDKGNAERLKARLERKYRNTHIVVYDRGDRIFYRVRTGLFSNLSQAAQFEKTLIADGFSDVFLVAR